MNTKVFPCGYYQSSYRPDHIKSIHFQHEVKKGIMNGMATIFVNDQRVCRTTFSDHFEFVKSSNHPIGKMNIITTDRAVINCLIALTTLLCFAMTVIKPDLNSVWISVGILLYLVQLVEVVLSETFRLTRHSSSWDDLDVFRDWYHELKKCRPMVNFSFTPTKD